MKTKILAIALAAAAASIAADETTGFASPGGLSSQRNRKTYRFVFSTAVGRDNPAAVASSYRWNAIFAADAGSDRHRMDW